MLSEAEAAFRTEFGGEPAWSGRAPGRVNLIGEHVDYMGGLVLPAAIDRYVAVAGALGPAWEVRSRVSGGERYLMALASSFELAPQLVAASADLPARSGLSSSAALLVAAARAWGHSDLDGIAAAAVCRRAEQQATGVQVGAMDHLAACLGRRGHALLIDLTDQDRPQVELLPFPVELSIAVIDSGVERELSQTPYNRRREEAMAAHPRRRRHIESENLRVRAFAEALRSHQVDRLGPLLDQSHASLRDDYEVSLPSIDDLVSRATRLPGCLGARIMGAGFGGSVLALVRAGDERRFAQAIGAPVLFCQTADGAFA